MSEEAHALHAKAVPEVAPPTLDYRPPMPVSREHPIALIGAGGIASAHLDAYRKAGFNVRVIASPTLAHAVARRDEFFPEAEATDDVAATLARPDIAVVDITTHPEVRAAADRSRARGRQARAVAEALRPRSRRSAPGSPTSPRRAA